MIYRIIPSYFAICAAVAMSSSFRQTARTRRYVIWTGGGRGRIVGPSLHFEKDNKSRRQKLAFADEGSTVKYRSIDPSIQYSRVYSVYIVSDAVVDACTVCNLCNLLNPFCPPLSFLSWVFPFSTLLFSCPIFFPCSPLFSHLPDPFVELFPFD